MEKIRENEDARSQNPLKNKMRENLSLRKHSLDMSEKPQQYFPKKRKPQENQRVSMKFECSRVMRSLL